MQEALFSIRSVVSGTPTAVGTYSFTITATDSLGNAGAHAYAVVISAAPADPITVAPPSLPGGTVGTPYVPTVTAAGGTAPYVYTIVSGALPPGLALNANTGAIIGTPTVPGSYTFTVQVTDALGNFGLAVLTIVIAAATPVGNTEAIPTLSQWALVMLGLLLSAISVRYLRRD